MRIVVVVSGSGTNLQAVLDAVASGALPVEVVAVGSDVPGAQGLARAEAHGIETFTVVPGDHASRAEWDAALADAIAAREPDWVVCSGFMRILGAPVLEQIGRASCRERV